MKCRNLSIVLSFLILSCATSKQAQDKYRSLAVEKFKENIDYVYNESKSFVLCVSAAKPTALKPQNSIRFFVYDINNDAIVMEESLTDGSARWINDRSIEVRYALGVDSKDPAVPHSGSYLFDVLTKEKISHKTETQ